jgi:hypothetical protein
VVKDGRRKGYLLRSSEDGRREEKRKRERAECGMWEGGYGSLKG